jgi:hypothetical protein
MASTNTDKQLIQNLNKTDCLKFIKANAEISIHPLLNAFYDYTTYPSHKDKPDSCYILPQIMKNKAGNTIITNVGTNLLKEIKKTNVTDVDNLQTDTIDNLIGIDDNLIDQSNKSNKSNQSNQSNQSNKSNQSNQSNQSNCLDDFNCIDPVLNFMIPINNSNFLDVVFQITSVEDLNDWISNYDIKSIPIEIINIVLDLFWLNYYQTIDSNLNSFIKLNQKLINIVYNRNVSLDITTKIVRKLIKNNFGKKIKYLNKIKKYLTKYI